VAMYREHVLMMAAMDPKAAVALISSTKVETRTL
jgi:hypothetical protein